MYRILHVISFIIFTSAVFLNYTVPPKPPNEFRRKPVKVPRKKMLITYPDRAIIGLMRLMQGTFVIDGDGVTTGRSHRVSIDGSWVDFHDLMAAIADIGAQCHGSNVSQEHIDALGKALGEMRKQVEDGRYIQLLSQGVMPADEGDNPKDLRWQTKHLLLAAGIGAVGLQAVLYGVSLLN